MTQKYTVSSLLLVVFTIIWSFAVAQNTPKGSIVGKIIDAKTGETLPGAIAMVEGSNQGASADLDGNFAISNVPVGTHKLIVKFISYKSKQITDIVVEQGKVAKVTISMEASANDLTEVVVTASAKRETVASLLIQQKNSINVSDGISAETIKRSPDRNTGDAIKRVSGASIQDNKYAIIRGLNDRYNMAMINGAPLPTSEPDRRAFSFDLFPANMVDNLVITKTASPDMPAEFAGGIISINTKDIPDENYYNFSASGGYNSQSTGQAYYSPAVPGKKDWLGIDDGTRALPSGLPEDVTQYRANSTTFQQKVDWSKPFKNDFGVNQNSSMPISQTYQFNMGQKFKVLGNDMGSVFALSYNNNRRTVVTDRADYDAIGRQEFFFADTAYNNNVLIGGLWNLGYKIGDNSKISINNTYSINTENSVVRRMGSLDPDNKTDRATFQQFTSTRLYASQIQGEHLLPWNNVKVKWGGSIAQTQRSVPNQRTLFYHKNFPIPDDADSQGDSAYVAEISTSVDVNSAGRFFSELNEKLYSGRFDVTTPFEIAKQKQSFKLGYYTQLKKRDFYSRLFGYQINNVSQFYQNRGKSLLIYDESSIVSPENISTKGFSISETTNPSDSYNASSAVNSIYGMFENTYGSWVKLAWGVRMERYNQKLSTQLSLSNKIEKDTTVTDWLPSANLILSPTEKINIRGSYYKTLSRPEFRELAPFAFYDFTNRVVVQGNPKLQRTIINNYDVRFEIYPGEGQLFAITGFYKEFSNAIEYAISNSTSGGSRTYEYKNADMAYARGIEIEWRQKLSPISKLISWKQFENFTIFTNLSFIESKVKVSTIGITQTVSNTRSMQGQSPYIYNAGLTYNWLDKGTNFTVLFNQVGRRIAVVGNYGYKDIYEAPRPILDFQVSQRIFKGADLKITLGDVMNRYSIFYQDFNDNGKYDEGIDTRIRRIRYGYNINVGFSYKF